MLDVIELPYGMQMLWPVHCVEGTDGAAIEGVDTMKADLVLRKGRELNIDSYSAFCAADNETKTALAGCLRERGITDVWVCGLALDYCVSFHRNRCSSRRVRHPCHHRRLRRDRRQRQP